MRTFQVLFVLTLAACGSSVTSVDGDTKTKDLSPGDKTQLCQDVANYVAEAFSPEEIARIGCGFSGSDDTASCEAAFEECVANAPKVTPIADAANCEAFESMLAGCDATVDEFATCTEQMVDALASLEDKVPLCSQEAQLSAFYGLQNDISTECLTMFTSCQVSIDGASSQDPPE